MKKSKYKLNPNPRLSANQLAELVAATPTRRRTIIQSAKFPKAAIVAQYRDANDAILNFLITPARINPDFSSQITALEEKSIDSANSDWTRSDAARSAEALKRVQQTYNQVALGSLDLRPLPNNKPKVIIEGVSVSASAVCSVHGLFRKKPAIGCLSILINKTEQSTKVREEKCRGAAVISVLYSKQNLKKFGEAAPKLSLSYDVFHGKLIPAPATYIKRLSDMSAACEDVMVWWDKIDAPAGYDGPTS